MLSWTANVEPPSDLDLLEAWRQGDRAAGEILFERHFQRIYRFFRTKLDEGAEDLTQRTFLACLEGVDRFRRHSSLRTYLFGIARRQLLMHYRKRGYEERLIEAGSVSAIDLGASPGTVMAAQQEQQLLLRALESIPVTLQITLELYYWEGLSTPELAAVLEIPEGTVRGRLTRARKLLAIAIPQLATQAEVADRTVSQLDHWAESLRDSLEVDTGKGAPPRDP